MSWTPATVVATLRDLDDDFSTVKQYDLAAFPPEKARHLKL